MHRPFERDFGPMADPGRLGRFVGVVCGVGIGALVGLVACNWDWTWTGQENDTLPTLLLTTLLVFLGELRPLLRRHTDREQASTTVFTIALLMLAGCAVAAVVQAAASLVGGAARRSTWWRALFNVAQYTLSLAAASLTLRLFGVMPTASQNWHPTTGDIPAVLAAGMAYFVVNLYLVWQAIGIWTGTRLRVILRRDLSRELQVVGATIMLAPLITVVMFDSRWMLPLFIPCLLLFYKNARALDEREYQSLHDPLTNLPNRKFLAQQAEIFLGTPAGVSKFSDKPPMYFAPTGTSVMGVPAGKVGLFLLDLDRFKEVNDTLGHAAGDDLICEVARRLAAAVRAEDTVARLGGDEFAVLLPGLPDKEAAEHFAQRLLDAVAVPYRLHGFNLDIEASLGIALHPDDAKHYDVLLRHADVAMYEAKRNKSGWAAYDPGKDRNSPDRLALLGDLRRALETGKIEVFYQPQASFEDDRVVGVEALARWRHPVRGHVSPETFVKLAESSGLMPRLTEYVLDMALAQSARWWGLGYGVPIAVNVSMRDIESNGFVELVARKLALHRVRPEALRLEVTERVLLNDPQRAETTLRGLSKLGVRLSLDDFGTGYASLLTLRRLPFDEIKIDRSFVERLTYDAEDAAIVHSTIDLAHSLGLRVVAEGVEDRATWHMLDGYGCDEAQGYLVSKALPSGEVSDLLARRVPRSVKGAVAEVAIADLAAPGGMDRVKGAGQADRVTGAGADRMNRAGTVQEQGNDTAATAVSAPTPASDASGASGPVSVPAVPLAPLDDPEAPAQQLSA